LSIRPSGWKNFPRAQVVQQGVLADGAGLPGRNDGLEFLTGHAFEAEIGVETPRVASGIDMDEDWAVKISELMSPATINLKLTSNDRDAVLFELVSLAANQIRAGGRRYGRLPAS